MPESAPKLFFNQLCQTVLVLYSILANTAQTEESSHLSQSILMEVENQYGDQSTGRLRLTYSQCIDDDSYQMILAYDQLSEQKPMLLDNTEHQIRPFYGPHSKDILLIHSTIKIDPDLQPSPTTDASRHWHKFVSKMQSVHY